MPLLLISCVTTEKSTLTTKLTNLSPASLYSTPSTTIFSAPDIPLEKYKSFSVFPLSLISEEIKMNPILERQLLFYVRNLLEAKGYEFVRLDQNPDFLVTVRADAKYHERYVPPSTFPIPFWTPGKTITTFGTSSGHFNFNTFGDFSSYGRGNWSGSDTKTTYIPGDMTLQTLTKPGYTIGHFYPIAIVEIYDGKTQKNVWIGSGAGTSDNSDVRISGQFVLQHILKDFPNYTGADIIKKEKMDGIEFSIFTNDGNSYFPTVISLRDDSIAKKAGLETHDMITEVNGVSTLNKPLSEFFNLLNDETKKLVNFKVKRLYRTLDVPVSLIISTGQPQIYRYQTRIYNTNDVKLFMRALYDVLKNDDFLIQQVNIERGILNAIKGETLQASIKIAWSDKQILVNANFQDKFVLNEGKFVTFQQVTEKYYNDFFSKFEKDLEELQKP